MWPTSENWPANGGQLAEEIDGDGYPYAFSHFADNGQDAYIGRGPAPVSRNDWHAWGFQWYPDRLVYTVDGQALAEVRIAEAIPHVRTAHIQYDWAVMYSSIISVGPAILSHSTTAQPFFFASSHHASRDNLCINPSQRRAVMRKFVISAALGRLRPDRGRPGRCAVDAPQGNAYGYNNYGQVRRLRGPDRPVQRQIRPARSPQHPEQPGGRAPSDESRNLERRLRYARATA